MHWWTLLPIIRNNSEVPFELELNPLNIYEKPLHYLISVKAIELHDLGMNYLTISKILNASDKTVKKAVLRHKAKGQGEAGV